ncbi:DUF2513 domain-containing protein [Bacillus subtilis]|uniref:DUF2513 domain-containing protein n=1 Tax=Bacillus TaxID=1386 RepID=UPI0018A794AB|nr:DUF2513 domain-containing protein [Bacillus subtilis]MBG9809138.1 hypothetical protein [Bacillus subtilis]QPG30444.1 DUF2513 domain-containing protein [Bacillus subtilis]QTM25131.1 DUF2513 domain-containing protein [Bacillus subtilis]ULN55655.1 DUF2513 domain-containing protein [Bacillus subtilis]WOA21240.1 DUF2513 domain-containing protein [Bacillus subtilis]
MELKPDLVRETLLAIEKTGFREKLSFKDLYDRLEDSKHYDPDDVAYTLKKLIEGGLIFGSASDNLGYIAEELTFEGHEFLNNIREKSVWESTRNVISTVGGASLKVFGDVAKYFVKSKLREIGVITS